MRQLIYILTILILLISCKNDVKKSSSENKNIPASTEVIDYDTDFNKWKGELEIGNAKIIDTTKEIAFELWAYRDELTKSDSSFYWYPSKDSSYYLITNFNRETNKRNR